MSAGRALAHSKRERAPAPPTTRSRSGHGNRKVFHPYTGVMAFRFAAVSALACALVIAALPAPALDEAGRDHWLQPERVMDAVGVGPGMVVGEIGAGRGYFTVKLARRVGREGRVYANDINARSLAALERRSRKEDLPNIVTVEGEEDDPLLPERSLEIVFLVYSLHDISRPVALLRNLRPSLAQGALVVVLDEDPDVTGDDHFLPRQKVLELFTEAGYNQVPLDNFLDRDLLLAFRAGSGH